MRINREKIQRMIDAQGGSGGGGGMSSAALEGMLAMYATRQWVQTNFLTIEFFSKLFTIHGANNTTVDPNDMTTTIESVESMFGFWTQFYLSALGTGGQQTLGLRLSQLDDVSVGGVTNGQVLTWNSSLGEWIASTPQSGIDMSVVWSALAGATSQQINASHLTNALSGYATETWVSNNFASETWVSNNFLALAGGAMHAGARISASGGNLTIGNSNNAGWLMFQDCCSQSGSSYWSIHASGDAVFANVLSNGYVTALSDVREKRIMDRFTLNVEEIAKASLIRYRWKDGHDDLLHVGGIAQEWQKILPEAVVEGTDGRLSMDYGVIAMVSAVSLARKIQDQDNEIRDLREKNAQLERRLHRLESMFAVDVD